jgi:hypothetical protein
MQAQKPGSKIRDAMQLVQPLPTGGYIVAVRRGSTVSHQAKTDALNGGDTAQQ